EEIRLGRMREDLFYRLNVVPIESPPLRVRTGDVPILANNFLERFAAKYGKYFYDFTPDAIDLLSRYDWPGNVRELENVIERAVLFCDRDVIAVADLPGDVQQESLVGGVDMGELAADPGSEGDGLKERVKAATSRLERTLINKALEQTGGNVTHAARILKISRKGLQLKMKELGLRERDDRTE
ncbi:MAG TPA: helix-turn-helix domain-containing protein, partial [Polyangiaceae bacterium]|nr:helix-turn-helix domain-containing protein [Polyangiaceae bacterium]